jgi:hypothetical protein
MTDVHGLCIPELIMSTLRDFWPLSHVWLDCPVMLALPCIRLHPDVRLNDTMGTSPAWGCLLTMARILLVISTLLAAVILQDQDRL